MDEININLEDLEEPEPPPGPAAQPGGEDLLVIEPEDLVDVAPLPAAADWTPARPGAYPPPQAYGPPLPGAVPGAALPVKSGLSLSHVAGWGLLQMALAGALGGFLAWACLEPFTTDQPTRESVVTILLRMSAFGSLLGGLIGAALGSVEGISARVVDKALKGAGLGLLIGGAGGALGGLFGQILYGALGGGAHANVLRQIAVRAIAWGLVGVFVGLGQGALGATPRKLLNGLMGGAIGGFVGGFLFDPISVIVGLFFGGVGPHAGWLSRVIAMVVTGVCTGAAIGLVQELRKEAWVLVAAGPLTGKQFILYRPTTTVGSSPKADICLIKDPAILPQHAVLQQSGQGHLLLASPEAIVAVNGRPAARHPLRSGDLIGLGQTVLEYRLKAVAPEAAPY